MDNKAFGLREGVLEKIIELGIGYGAERLVIFGSRARGDYKERSDIDLAIYGGNPTEFALDVDELTPTLLQFDIVDMNKPVQKELRDSIEKEGVVIYEKV